MKERSIHIGGLYTYRPTHVDKDEEFSFFIVLGRINDDMQELPIYQVIWNNGTIDTFGTFFIEKYTELISTL